MTHQKTGITRRTALASAAAFIAAPGLVRAATTHKVDMLNKHPDNPRQRFVFVPRIIVVKPGDTVTFLPTDPGHNSASIDGMLPEGAEDWKSRINKEISVTFETPGIYGYKCDPHYAVGMVGLVITEGEGMMDNYEAAQEVRQRGRAGNAFEEIWEEVAAMDLSA